MPATAPTDSPAVEIRALHKQFKGAWGRHGVYAVKGISLCVPRGSIYGLIGPNGSGKSTVMKTLIGLLRPTAGECFVFGEPAHAPRNRRNIGFLPENPYFYKFLTGEETLRFYGRLCGLHGTALKEKTAELLALTGLKNAAKRRLGGYSKGMLQRIGLAQALIQNPRLVVLDEPTAGVDPIGSRTIRDLILELKRRGVTVFLCSHLLAQVQEICDRVGILCQGLLIAEGSMDELTRNRNRSELLIEHASPALLEELKRLIAADADARLIFSGAASDSLEEIFLRGVQRQIDAQAAAFRIADK